MNVPALWSHPDVMEGKVCLSGTCVPISVIWQLASMGRTPTAICGAFPQILPAAIEAAVGMVEWTPKPDAFNGVCNFMDNRDSIPIDMDDAEAILAQIKGGNHGLPKI